MFLLEKLTLKKACLEGVIGTNHSKVLALEKLGEATAQYEKS